MPIESSAFTPSSLSSATTATGSVALTITPRTYPAISVHASAAQPSASASPGRPTMSTDPPPDELELK